MPPSLSNNSSSRSRSNSRNSSRNNSSSSNNRSRNSSSSSNSSRSSNSCSSSSSLYPQEKLHHSTRRSTKRHGGDSRLLQKWFSPVSAMVVKGTPMSPLLVFALLLMTLHCHLVAAHEDVDVASLEGDSDFNRVRLHWRYPRMGADFGGFKVTHCEDQAWGPHRCRNIVLHPNELSQTPLRDGLVEYSGQVSHLRMATNYTIEVTPVSGSPDSQVQNEEGRRTSSARGRAIPDASHHSAQVFIQTKGFSARALSCLTNSTQVEVDTGPNFGGKISVEGSQDPRCATQGNAKAAITKYRLDIGHALCGSKLMNDSVRTYILVQENLPILTHSTRRFMVVCHYVPDAFTVSAGVSLPEDSGPSLVPVDNSVNEVDPSELFDSTNDLFGNGRLTAGVGAGAGPDLGTLSSRRKGKALQLAQEQEPDSPRMWTQLVLMVILVVGAVVGLSCAFWHFGRHAGLAARTPGGEAEDELDSVECSRADEPSFHILEDETEQQELEQEHEEQPEQQPNQHQQQCMNQPSVLAESVPILDIPCLSFQTQVVSPHKELSSNTTSEESAPEPPPRRNLLRDDCSNDLILPSTNGALPIGDEIPIGDGSEVAHGNISVFNHGNSIALSIGADDKFNNKKLSNGDLEQQSEMIKDAGGLAKIQENIYANSANRWESFEDDESLKGIAV